MAYRRRAAMQPWNQMRQQVRADGVNHPQPQHPGQLVLTLSGDLPDRRRFVQHPPRLLDNAPTHRRDL
jgi:hypothetical protein